MTTTLQYLTLDELEKIAFAHPGFDIVAAQGTSGPEWLLRVSIAGAEKTFRAHRAVYCTDPAPAESVITR